LTITLSRGVVEKSAASKTFGSASVTALQVTVKIDCGKVPALGTLNETLSKLNVAMVLCGGSGVQAASGRSAGMAMADTGVKSLVDVRLGYASAVLSTTPGQTTTSSPCTVGCGTPTTGNNLWILAAFAAALVLAGAGFQFFRSRPSRA
jgi:hypothetical protein